MQGLCSNPATLAALEMARPKWRNLKLTPLLGTPKMVGMM